MLRDVADAARVRHHALHLVRVRVRVRVRIRRSPPEGDVGEEVCTGLHGGCESFQGLCRAVRGLDWDVKGL